MADGDEGSEAWSPRTGVPLPPDLQKKLEKLSPEERAKAEQELEDFVQQSVTVAFQAPLPPPFMVDGYERHHPGFLSELLRRAKEAQDHIHEMDRAELDGQFGYLNRGQLFGFVIALTAIVGAVMCAALNQWQIGVALGLTGLAPVIGHFLRNPFAALQKLPDGKAIDKTSRKKKSSPDGDED